MQLLPAVCVLSAYTFPLGWRMELKLCVTGSRWYVSALCWLADKWAEIGKSVTVEFTRNGRTMKKISKIKKSSMESAGSYSGHYSLFLTVSLQLFECQMNSLHGWLTNNSTRENDLQMGCTTYFVCCLHHTAELPADRQAIPGLPTPSLPNHRFQYTGSQSEESCFKQEADSGWTEGLYKGSVWAQKD